MKSITNIAPNWSVWFAQAKKIVISAQMGLRAKNYDLLLFFFSSLRRQPTNQGPVRHSDPGFPEGGTPLTETSFYNVEKKVKENIYILKKIILI